VAVVIVGKSIAILLLVLKRCVFFLAFTDRELLDRFTDAVAFAHHLSVLVNHLRESAWSHVAGDMLCDLCLATV
jgi:hypothetical protein